MVVKGSFHLALAPVTGVKRRRERDERMGEVFSFSSLRFSPPVSLFHLRADSEPLDSPDIATNTLNSTKRPKYKSKVTEPGRF